MGAVSRRRFLACIAAWVAVPPVAGNEVLSRFPGFASGTRVTFATATPPDRLTPATAVSLLNVARRARSRTELVPHATLSAVAREQVTLMAGRNVFAHAVGPGLSLAQRMRRYTYPGKVAENLAHGQTTFEDAILDWMQSGYHRTTMLSARYRYAGAAVATVADRARHPEGIYWAVVFGT